MAESDSDESGEVHEERRGRKASSSRPTRSPQPDREHADVGGERRRGSRWDPGEESEEADAARDGSAEPPAKRSRWADEDADGDDAAGLDDRSFGLVAKDAGVEAGAAVQEEEILRGDAEPVLEAPRLDMLQGCRAKDKTFDIIKEVGSGTYGLVTKARAKDTDKVHALKKIKLPPSFTAEGFPMTSVREINLLLSLKHANIVDVTEVVAQGKDIYMVMEFVQQDLKKFLETYKTRLKIGEVKRIVHQLLDGIAYLHENWVLHRDLKPANVLYDAFGNIKICDFGLARHFGDPVPHMTPVVVTRNYRGPEICLGVTNYTPALDVWSIGVIVAELLTGKVPFIESKSDIDLVNAIGRVIGSPHGSWAGLEQLPRYHKIDITKGVPSTLRQKLNVQAEGSLPLALDTAVSQQGYDFIASLLQWDPAQRPTAAEAMQHAWFEEMPRMTEACFMPQTNEHLRRKYA